MCFETIETIENVNQSRHSVDTREQDDYAELKREISPLSHGVHIFDDNQERKRKARVRRPTDRDTLHPHC